MSDTAEKEMDRWWDCPSCGADTEVDGGTRSCLECDWLFTIPDKSELKDRGYDV